MIDILDAMDAEATVFVNSFHNSFFDSFMMLFSGRFVWVPMYATIMLILYRHFGFKKTIVFTVFIALTITAADQLCASYLRPVVSRLRPAHLDNPLSELIHVVDGYRGGLHGFPSCHAANSFALVTFLALLVRRGRFLVFIYLWAVLNSYSRLYLGVHYLGDLLVGALIGSMIGAVMYYIGARIANMVDPATRSSYVSQENEGKPVVCSLHSYDIMMMTGITITIVMLVVSTFKVCV